MHTSSTGQTGTVFSYFISHTTTVSASGVRAQPPKRAAHFCVPINKHQCCQCFTLDVTDFDKIAHVSQLLRSTTHADVLIGKLASPNILGIFVLVMVGDPSLYSCLLGSIILHTPCGFVACLDAMRAQLMAVSGPFYNLHWSWHRGHPHCSHPKSGTLASMALVQLKVTVWGLPMGINGMAHSYMTRQCFHEETSHIRQSLGWAGCQRYCG